MEKLSDPIKITDENTEILWDMIKDVQENKEGSLLKLANELMEAPTWINLPTHESQR